MKKKKLNSKLITNIVLYIILIILVVLFTVKKLNVEIIQNWFGFILEGLGVTLYLALCSAFFGALIGVVLAVLKNTKSNILEAIVNFYLDFFRGTPVIVQVTLLYYAVAPMIGWDDISPITCAIISFSLNSGAYISEIIRAGINSIDKGQIEAAKALGVKGTYIYRDIILPIAFRNIFPSLLNEFITLVKETAIVSTIGVSDLMRRYSMVVSKTYSSFEPIMVIAIIYFITVKLLTVIAAKVEAKLQYD